MNKSLLLILSALAGSLIPGCGSSGSSGNSSCSTPSSMGSSPACESCVKSACSSSYAAFCSNNCATGSSSSACQKATGDIFTCVLQSCSSQCVTVSGSGGAGTGSGGTGSGGTHTGSGGTGVGAGGLGANSVQAICYVATDETCTSTRESASAKAALDSACTQGGGTTPATCPTANLLGCCTFAGLTESCFYSGAAGALTEAECTQSGGVWSATP